MARKLRLRFASEEFLTELATDKAVEDVNKVVEQDPQADTALADIEKTETEAQDVREELNEGDTTDPMVDGEDTGDTAGTGDTPDANADPADADTSGDPAQNSDPAEAGDEANKVDDADKKDDKDAVPASESIFARWRA